MSAPTPMSAAPRRSAALTAVGLVMAVGLAMGLGLFAAVAVEAEPRTPGRVAAVFPPWWSAAQVVGAAGSAGDIAGVGRAPFIVILRGDPAALSARARAAGALVLLDPALAGVCARPASSSVNP